MALRFFSGRSQPDDPAESEPVQPMSNDPATNRDENTDEERRPAARRGTRGRRGGRGSGSTTATRDRAEDIDDDRDDQPAESDEEAPARPRRRSSTTRTRAESADADPAPRTSSRDGADPTLTAILRQLETQNEQMRTLIELQQQLVRGGGSGGSNSGETVTAAPRVGIFVDSANIELAAERMRKRIDWGKAMAMLTRNRHLVRAVAYSPTHDDPGVSMETQRFVEPFLDHGFKIVTKPLKRFADGSIKANVDIELALDLLAMCDRLDVVCLVSGDGDFQHLVETVQERGLRVEVIGLGGSVSAALRKAADAYVDLDPATVSATPRGGRN